MFEPTLPNLLTVLRMLLVPVLVAALLTDVLRSDLLAAVVFVIASATDFLDGHLARRRSSVSSFGKLMDPIADKLLIIAALVSLVSLDRLAAWVAMVIIARELVVTVLRVVAMERGVIISASLFGKLKTTVQVVTIFALIATDGAGLATDLLVYATVLVTVASGLDYLARFRRTLADGEAAGAARQQRAAGAEPPERPAVEPGS